MLGLLCVLFGEVLVFDAFDLFYYYYYYYMLDICTICCLVVWLVFLWGDVFKEDPVERQNS